jgi:asparagine synthase (glutamine-hydrolysing)
MCGIAGVYNIDEAIERGPVGLELLAHRGPDASGHFRTDTPVPVWLGHRRLTIIDLSDAANQPFRDAGLVLVYNGEIYNYRELRSQLEAGGYRFRTSSDTEVLLAAWKTWGPACLPKLRGMFAFAMLEEATGRLFLARDPFGIKPLYVYRSDRGLAFASEAKALAEMLGAGLSVDATGLVSSLMYYWVPEAHSAFGGLERLQPGHWAVIDPDGTYSVSRYFDPVGELGHRELTMTAPELAEVIDESVAAHLVSDVPVGAFLSGGLDSSILAAIAARNGTELSCFTIAFRPEDSAFEAMPDDAHYARMIAELHDLPLTEIEIAPDIVDMLPRMVRVLDEPIGDPAAINTVLISEAARAAGIKVLLSGMGADELFGGYRKHQAAIYAQRYRRLPRWAREGVVEPIVTRVPVATRSRGLRYARWAKRFIGFASMSESEAFHRSYALFGRSDFEDLLSPDLMPVVDELLTEHEAVYSSVPELDLVNRMCFTDSQMFMSGLNLTYTDRASMSESTEVRVPYIDVDVARAAFSTPGSKKIVGSRRKAILRDAAKGLLPAVIIERPKGLFSAPLRSWIRRDLSTMIDDLVVGGRLVRDGILRKQAVVNMVEEDRAGTSDRSKELWELLTLEIWLDEVGSRLHGDGAVLPTGSIE